MKSDKEARLLLMLGAEVSGSHMTVRDRHPENAALLKVLEYKLGGRRCEIVGLEKKPQLNGKIGVATKYLPKKERYVFQFLNEPPNIQVRPVNLKRRDYAINDT
jgi:hypothetical protein